MNFATRIVFFTILTVVASIPKDTPCPSYSESDYQPFPGEIMTNPISVFSNFRSTCILSAPENLTSEEIRNLGRKLIDELISEKCETALMQNACLYECSQEFAGLKIFIHKILNPDTVPICLSSCVWLYGACLMEITCAEERGEVFPDFDIQCNNQSYLPLSKSESTSNKFQTAEKLCAMMTDSGIFNMTTSDEDCFNLKTRRYVERTPKTTDSTTYNIFAYMGMAVIGVLICLAIYYAVIYFMKRHRIARSL